ncbi:ABC transporter substrate-binding protein [Paenibacillus sp. IHB B 3415]|uniref:ABC transporter substrate-binding protein n=1 Tax=Paenibacillus sp. IHB B 3415 TaxID=867080 RepID=UPI000575E181|nr:ABC transporter substrate-binding protein [Paenibacillus sp. IHB B 3415]KHL94089.1 ABC transporter substrate-binding protein [Paenibacillus sp. IHB B 3415]
MNKKFKISTLACCLAMTTTLLAGCNSGGNNASPSPAAAGTEAPSAQPAESAGDSGYKQASPEDAPTIVWWQIGTQPTNLAEAVAKINEYTAEKIGVKVDIKVAGWGDYDTKMNTIINTGEDFDIMFVNNTNYNRFINLGALADITDSAQKDTPELYSFIPETVWNGTKMNGKIYSVPTYKDSSMTQYFVWDDSIVQKYNIDYANIKTIQDLDKPFRDIKAGEGKSYYPLQLSKGDGFAGLLNDYDDMTLGLKALGVKVDDTSRKVVSVFEQPEIMDKLKLIHSWYKDGIINPDAPTLSEPPKMLPFFSAQGFPGAEAGWQVNNGVDKYVMTQIFGPMYTTSTIQGSLNAISQNSKYKVEALKFLELVNTDPQLRNMLAYGIEGQDWKTVGDNVIERLNDTWSLPGYSQGTFFNMAAVAPNSGDQWDAVKKLNEEASASALLGFALDINNLSTEVANCKAVMDKYQYELLTGASDPEVVVPKLVKELKAAGMETIMEEAQKQITEYFK